MQAGAGNLFGLKYIADLVLVFNTVHEKLQASNGLRSLNVISLALFC